MAVAVKTRHWRVSPERGRAQLHLAAANLPYQITGTDSVVETYVYNADDARVKKVRAGVSTSYLEGGWEEDSTGLVRKHYTLAGQTVAVRNVTSTNNAVTYPLGDRLGSVSITTNGSGVASTPQEYDL